MLSYQHEYHAGNFADLHKHLVLFAVLEALSNKPKPWTAVDLYAGSGLYRLAAHPQAARGADDASARRWPDAPEVQSDEWRRGYGCLRDHRPMSPLLARFRDALDAFAGMTSGAKSSRPSTTDAAWAVLPGSPAWIVRAMRRRSAPSPAVSRPAFRDAARPDPVTSGCALEDRAIFCERHPRAHAALRRWAGALDPCSAAGIAVHRRDAGEAVGALLPPRVRRGVVLIDPPYERLLEYDEVAEQVATARRRWPEATVLLWSPRLVDQARDRAAVALVERVLVAERRRPGRSAEAPACWTSRLSCAAPAGLIGSTMTVLAAPYRLEDTLVPALSEVAARLRHEDCGGRDAVHAWHACTGA